MTKFRKKPVVIDAQIYEPGMEDGYELAGNAHRSAMSSHSSRFF